MKYLTLIRHAEAGPGRDDFLRPLTGGGMRDAHSLGLRLERDFQFAPYAILCSPAVRTLSTARLMADSLPGSVFEIRGEARLYNAAAETVLALIREQPDGTGRLCLIGHNPGLEDLTGFLSGGSATIHPGTAVQFELETDSWSGAGPETARLVSLVHPCRPGTP